jgi:hypothetical protein
VASSTLKAAGSAVNDVGRRLQVRTRTSAGCAGVSAVHTRYSSGVGAAAVASRKGGIGALTELPPRACVILTTRTSLTPPHPPTPPHPATNRAQLKAWRVQSPRPTARPKLPLRPKPPRCASLGYVCGVYRTWTGLQPPTCRAAAAVPSPKLASSSSCCLSCLGLCVWLLAMCWWCLVNGLSLFLSCSLALSLSARARTHADTYMHARTLTR